MWMLVTQGITPLNAVIQYSHYDYNMLSLRNRPTYGDTLPELTDSTPSWLSTTPLSRFQTLREEPFCRGGTCGHISALTLSPHRQMS